MFQSVSDSFWSVLECFGAYAEISYDSYLRNTISDTPLLWRAIKVIDVELVQLDLSGDRALPHDPRSGWWLGLGGVAALAGLLASVDNAVEKLRLHTAWLPVKKLKGSESEGALHSMSQRSSAAAAGGSVSVPRSSTLKTASFGHASCFATSIGTVDCT